MLVALTVGAYVAQVLIEYFLAERNQSALIREYLAFSVAGLGKGQYWQLVSYPLLHLNPLHLLGNVLLLYMAGREVEQILGTRHFLMISGLGTLIGSLTQWAVAPETPLLGITPAVVAMIVAFTTILPELEVRFNLFFVIPVCLRAKYIAYALLLGCGLLWWNHTHLESGPAGALIAGCIAWLYVKQLGFGNPLGIQKYIFEKRQRAARLDRMSAEQFIHEEVDPILDKIAREGMARLTRREKKILEQCREKMVTKTNRK